MASPKIFGLGLSRTGTTSLHAALLLLGKASVHYPLDAARYWLAGNFSGHDPLSEFDACLDNPTPVYFRELDQVYPASRFILTLRSKESWADSVGKLFSGLPPSGPGTQLRDMVRLATYGTVNFHHERYCRLYEEHNDAVREYFKDRPESLLVMDITAGDGWDRLCPFLGVESPQVAFPRLGSPAIGELAAVRRGELASKRPLLERLVRDSASASAIGRRVG